MVCQRRRKRSLEPRGAAGGRSSNISISDVAVWRRVSCWSHAAARWPVVTSGGPGYAWRWHGRYGLSSAPSTEITKARDFFRAIFLGVPSMNSLGGGSPLRRVRLRRNPGLEENNSEPGGLDRTSDGPNRRRPGPAGSTRRCSKSSSPARAGATRLSPSTCRAHTGATPSGPRRTERLSRQALWPRAAFTSMAPNPRVRAREGAALAARARGGVRQHPGSNNCV